MAAALAAVLLGGCATSVAGSATPVVGAATQQSGTAGTGTGPETAGPDTTGPETTGPETTDPETTDPETTSPPDTSETDPTSEGGTTTDPTGSEDTGTEPTDGPGDPALYPSEPVPYNENPSTEESAALLEARRLAAFSVAPPAVDPRFSETASLSTVPLKGPDALSLVLTDPAPAIAKRAKMYTGFTSARGEKDGPASLLIAAFVFPDGAAATKAAKDLGAAGMQDGDTKVAVPGQSKAVGSIGKSSDGYSAQAFVATDAVVAYAWTTDAAAQRDELPGILGDALTAQVKSLADYTPTPPGKLMSLKVDPEGLYSRTLPVEKGTSTVTNGSWPAAGALHTQIIYPDSAATFEAADVDVVSIGRSVVYRAKDAAGATSIRDAFYAEVIGLNPKMREFDPGTEAGSARCLQDTLRASYQCFAATGRYAIEYGSTSEDDITRSLEAQVALLEG